MRRAVFFTFISAQLQGESNGAGTVYRWNAATPPALDTVAQSITSGGYSIIEVAAGRAPGINKAPFFIFLRSDNTVWAWAPTVVPINNYLYTSTPTQISFGTAITKITAGNEICAGIDTSGRLWAWGNSAAMGIGGFAAGTYTTPRLVSITGSFVSVHVRNSSALALRHDGALYGWGDNSYRQLGHLGNGSLPEAVLAGTVTFSHFQVGAVSIASMGISATGSNLYLWGHNTASQCMRPSVTASVSTPVLAANSVKDTLCLEGRGLYLDQNGDVWTWGLSGSAPTWHTGGSTSIPTNRSFTPKFERFARNASNVIFALKLDKTVWGWGSEYAMLGDGSYNPTSPIQLAGSVTFNNVIYPQPYPSGASTSFVFGIT